MDNIIKTVKKFSDKNFTLIVVVLAIVMLAYTAKMMLDKKEAFTEYAEFIPIPASASEPCDHCDDCGGVIVSPTVAPIVSPM
jgi:ligand-binding sensor protein